MPVKLQGRGTNMGQRAPASPKTWEDARRGAEGQEAQSTAASKRRNSHRNR